MNKSAVNDQLETAYEAIIKTKIADGSTGEYKVKKAYRGQIATFGAAIITGSLKSAIAFFSDEGKASVNRLLIIKAIEYILEKRKIMKQGQSLFSYAKSESPEVKENIINAAIAIKLALNLFILVDNDDGGNPSEV